MGLGLVSLRSRSRGSKVWVSLETTLSRPQDLKGENENRGMKKTTQSVVDSNIPSEKICFSCRKIFLYPIHLTDGSDVGA